MPVGPPRILCHWKRAVWSCVATLPRDSITLGWPTKWVMTTITSAPEEST